MHESLLQTKLYIPFIRPDPAAGFGSRFIPRSHLLQQLNEGLPRKLTLISAPAGFGKTTLVSSWLQHVNHPAAWLSLDEDDNDFARFWMYFIAALQTIHPEVGTGMLAMLQSSPLPHSHTLLTLLINNLATISKKIILVLDDYHTIETEAIDQALTFFIDHIPSLMHLVINSRVNPNLSLSRLRANGQLNELHSADLRFTPTETAQFLEQATNLSLTADEVAALDKRTEGWIAGLQMTALSLRQREAATATQLIEDFSRSDRYIMDYLVDEVLQQQSAEIQTFLLYTSILDQFCVPLCEAILRESDMTNEDQELAPPPVVPDARKAQELLSYLEHANLFITPLDNQRQWYRYHHLFADLLRQRLNQMYPDQVAILHLRTSKWYEQAGLTGLAVQHALAAHAFDRAAMLIEQAAPALIQRSELARLLTWLDALPDDEVKVRPLLALYYAWGLLLGGKIKQADTWLDAIDVMPATDQAEQSPEVKSHIAALRAYLAREDGDFASTIDLSRQALAHLPEQDSLLRAMVTLNLAIAHYLQDEFESADWLLAETIATGQTAQLMANTLSAIYLNAQLLHAQGTLEQALQVCQEELELVARHGWQNFPAVGFVYVALGNLLYERNELTTAAEYLEKGIQLGQEGGHPHIMIIGHVWLARLRHAQGDVAGSQEAIRAALQLAQQHHVSRFWPIPPPASYQARLWIAQGNLAAASRWAQASGLDQAHVPVIYLYEIENLTLVRLMIPQGDLTSAESLLLQLHQAAESAGRNGSLIEILNLQAITFAAQKRSEEALSALGQALVLAEAEGFVRVFLDEGRPVVELLRQAVAQGLHVSYALRLLNALKETAAAQDPLIEPLSGRELEVLRRLAAGYSNKEIAQELVVAVSTVKKHINNIYAKLEVRSRTQAAARARELGLL